MKITKETLKRIIREELEKFVISGAPEDYDLGEGYEDAFANVYGELQQAPYRIHPDQLTSLERQAHEAIKNKTGDQVYFEFDTLDVNGSGTQKFDIYLELDGTHTIEQKA